MLWLQQNKLIQPGYIHLESVHNLSAPSVIVPFLIESFRPQSVVDVGCGIGTFLSIFQKNGVQDMIGIDGAWVNRKQLLIDESIFIEKDLRKELKCNRQFDLVLCLEVAEHLQEKAADIFVKSLVSLGKRIIFSAAVTNQGGQNHINEQDFDYWKMKFEHHGYSFYDIFRVRFWNNKDIDWWYKQNMFLVAHESVQLPEQMLRAKVQGELLVYIHPGALATRVSQIEVLKNELGAFRKGNGAFGTYIKGFARKIINVLGKPFKTK